MNFKYPIHLKETFSYLHEPEYVSRFARVYWRVLLTTAAILIILFSLYGMRQLLLLSELARVMPTSTSAAPPFDRNDLKEVLAGMAAREKRYEALKISPLKIADPSR